jgi:hypothetical protein
MMKVFWFFFQKRTAYVSLFSHLCVKVRQALLFEKRSKNFLLLYGVMVGGKGGNVPGLAGVGGLDAGTGGGGAGAGAAGG